ARGQTPRSAGGCIHRKRRRRGCARCRSRTARPRRLLRDRARGSPNDGAHRLRFGRTAHDLRSVKISDARTLFERMRERRVLVVGDVMVDEWIWGSVSRISPEAPVPVVAVSDHSFTLGGAGNVANNLRALGADVSLVGTVGNDDFARQVRTLLKRRSVNARGIVTLKD